MDQIQTERTDGILRIGFNRPEKKNALTAGMYAALADAIEAGVADASVRVILFHGKPEVYTSGNDLADFLANPPTGMDAPVFRFLGAISRCDKPVVAAVAGAAVGIGTTMLLHCDLVYAEPAAKFALPFVNLGLVPEAGSSLLLPMLTGHQRAARLLMLGEPFDAALAREVGFVTEVVPAEGLMAHALAAAAKLAAKPPGALRQTKALMKAPNAAAVAKAIADEAVIFGRCLASPEAKEAFSAFLEKRKPDFSKFG